MNRLCCFFRIQNARFIPFPGAKLLQFFLGWQTETRHGRKIIAKYFPGKSPGMINFTPIDT